MHRGVRVHMTRKLLAAHRPIQSPLRPQIPSPQPSNPPSSLIRYHIVEPIPRGPAPTFAGDPPASWPQPASPVVNNHQHKHPGFPRLGVGALHGRREDASASARLWYDAQPYARVELICRTRSRGRGDGVQQAQALAPPTERTVSAPGQIYQIFCAHLSANSTVTTRGTSNPWRSAAAPWRTSSVRTTRRSSKSLATSTKAVTSSGECAGQRVRKEDDRKAASRASTCSSGSECALSPSVCSRPRRPWLKARRAGRFKLPTRCSSSRQKAERSAASNAVEEASARR